MLVSQQILIGYQFNMGHLKAFCMPNHLSFTCTGDQVGNNPYVLFPTGASVMPVNYFLPDPVGNKTPHALLTALKGATLRQHVLSSQDPDTPWHLHSTLMFLSRSWNRERHSNVNETEIVPFGAHNWYWKSSHNLLYDIIKSSTVAKSDS